MSRILRYLADPPSKVTAGPSGKTSYVVLGENAGPSKLAKIKAHNIKTLTEDEFLNLIATREGELDEKQQAALEKEEKKILEQAKELEKRQQEEEREAKKAAVKNAKAGIATK